MDEIAGPMLDPGRHCYGGSPAPAPVVEGWRQLLDFPATAREGFWGLLQPVLEEPGHPGHQERLDAFCQEHALAEAPMLEAIQACDTLLHQAAAFDLDPDRFGQDLTALSGGMVQAPDAILALYENMKSELRGRLVQGTLADHGKVLLGLDWRVDRVISSDRGMGLEATVVLLSLRYREGDRLDRITLQLTPETLAELKRFAGRIEG